MQPDPTPPSPAQRPAGQVDLDEVRRRVEAATPGPWEHDPEGYMGCGSVWCASTDDSLFGGPIAEPSGDCYPRGGYNPQADMVFIAHARADVPALLADLDAARDALRRAQPVLEAAREWRQITRLVEELGEGRVSRPSKALIAAVDTYETQEGTDG